MKRFDFYKQEYISLREEIKETKARRYKTISYGILFVPAAMYSMEKFDVKYLSLALPLVVIVVAILYIYEHNAMMRCGKYIREKIEDGFGVHGWEHWLESDDVCRPRSVEKLLTISFILLYMVYYGFCTYMAFLYMEDVEKGNFSDRAINRMLGLYITMGIASVVYFYRKVKLCAK